MNCPLNKLILCVRYKNLSKDKYEMYDGTIKLIFL